MADAESLARRIAGLRDPALRVAYVRHELAGTTAEELADLLLVVAGRADVREEPYLELLLALSVALDDPSHQRLRRATLAAATVRGQADVLQLLGEGRSQREEEQTPRVPDFGVGRPLTLGERKSLARKNDRDLIARVLRDPDPDVIRILLGNPALTELDVVRLCARRPIAAEVLRQVFHAARWIVRYDVRRAIVLNPYAPLDVSMQLARLLTRPDRRRVAESGELHVDLRNACRRAPSMH